MEYFINELSRHVPNKYIGTYDTSESKAYDLMNCVAVSSDWVCPEICFECTAKEIPSFPSFAGPFPLAHISVIELIEEKEENLQIISAPVTAKDGVVKDFYAINLLKSYRVWDLEASEWKPLNKKMPEPFFMEDMIMLEDLNIPAKIFRNRDFIPHIVFSAKTAKRLSEKEPKWFMPKSIDHWEKGKKS